jgi:hypothetical protein
LDASSELLPDESIKAGTAATRYYSKYYDGFEEGVLKTASFNFEAICQTDLHENDVTCPGPQPPAQSQLDFQMAAVAVPGESGNICISSCMFRNRNSWLF